MRRTFTAVAVTAALALAPVGAAFAQDTGGTDEATTTTEGDDVGSVLDAWLAAVQDLFAQLTGEDETDDGSGDDGTGEDGTGEDGTGEEDTTEDGTTEGGDDADLLRTLFQALLDGVEIEFMVAEALEEADEGDAEGTEEDVELAEEGEEEGTEDEADEPHGHVVRLVAQCAPRGQEARGFLAGAKNHGAYVSAVARGDAITLEVPTIEDGEDGPVVGEPTTLDLTVTTVEDAETFCDALATIAEARALEAELAAAEGDEVDAASAREQRKADRDEAKAERAAEREQRKAERDEAKAQRAAERAAAKAERAAAKAERRGR